MVGSPSIGGKVRFGPFEADFHSGELRKLGVRIKLQGQPFKLLCLLIEHAGEIVTREELRQEIWGPHTVVDFDRSLGTAVNKVREALCDSADTPRYIETLARRGYRFIAEVQLLTATAAPLVTQREVPAPSVSEPLARPILAATIDFHNWRQRRWLAAGLTAAGFVAVWAAIFRTPPEPLVQFSQVTWSEHVYPGDRALERFPGVVTDGINIFFPNMVDRNLVLASASVSDGDARVLSMPNEIVRPSVADISPDGTRLLVLSMTWVEPEHQLWIVPTHGGEARKVPDALAHDATWLPDGAGILFASGHDLFVIRNDGSGPRKFASLSGRAFWIRYSPDASTIRLTIRDEKTGRPALWEMSAKGDRLHPLLTDSRQSQNDCCGNWTSDGNYIFQSVTKGMSNIWILRESKHWLWPSSVTLKQLTSGPLSYLSPVPERRGNRAFVIGSHARSQLLHFDSLSHQFSPVIPVINNADRVEFTRDKARVAWVSNVDGSLWQSLADGSQRMQLTSEPMRVANMHWSPDGQRLAFLAQVAGEPRRIYLVAASGGNPEILLKETRGQSDPSWAPDGNSIVYGRTPEYISEDTLPKAIYQIDLKTRSVVTLPGSQGFFSPRWSPDGRYILALPLNQRRLMMFDRTTGAWRVLASQSINNPSWSSRGDYVFFQSSSEEDQPIYRVAISSGRIEPVIDFRSLRQADKVDYLGLGPDDDPIVLLRFATADIYSMTYK